MNSFTLTMFARARKKRLKTADRITRSIQGELQRDEKNQMQPRFVQLDKRQLQLTPGPLKESA